MFRRLLVANRGEIAVRIIRCCAELGIETVAVYSKADERQLHTQLADTAICIGGAASKDSYLNAQAILTAASISNVDAVHPGFGFLSERADFAEMTRACGFVFIGPSPEVIRLMGDKAQARHQAREADVPLIPGSDGVVSSFDALKREVDALGYPVMIKAAAGGGGRGMRPVMSPEALEPAYRQAKGEARVAFGDDRVYVERLIVNPRHIEVQLMADAFGHVIHFGERDCSLQRRRQKLMEEAPSPFLDDALRAQLGADAVRLARHVGYEGAGTIEFLVDDQKRHYFMEMNTRIQVEHPVSEMTTGADLVRMQIECAAKRPLRWTQEDVVVRGHALECRINAEDPKKRFQPNAGQVPFVHLPGGIGVRVDSALYSGVNVPSDYDSLLAKIIVHAPTRTRALARMRRALMECQITGVKTNIDFLLAVLRERDVNEGAIDIGWMEREADRIVGELVREEEAL